VSADYRRILVLALLALLLVGLANGVLFFVPLYASFVDPSSSTGTFDRAIDEQNAYVADARRDVLVLGDSRVYGGLDPASADAAGDGLRFLNAGVPGSTPRTWFTFDRAIDPTARRFRAVVIPVDSYTDDTSAIGSLDAADHPTDAHEIVFHSGFADIPAFAGSFDEGALQRANAFDLALRGPVLRDDVQDLLNDPAARVSVLRNPPRGDFAPGAAHPFATVLTGLRIDFGQGTIDAPAWVSPAERVEIARQELPIAVESPAYAAYRRNWLGRIVTRYRAAGVPVVIVRIPARPIHRALPPPPAGSLVELAAGGDVWLVPQAPYVALEQPALFADHDHLDRVGSVLFSRLLARDVRHATDALAADRRQPAVVAPVPPHARNVSLRAWLGIGAPIPLQSWDYALFLGLVAVVFYALPRRWRTGWLLLASYYFYLRWNAWYVVLLGAITLCDFVVALLVPRLSGWRGRLALANGVGANLAFLGILKYTNFLTASLAALLGMHGDPWVLRLLVPVGISFHTFQSISYLVDVARGRVKPVTDLPAYALYIAFFPQLLSGPIVRAARFFGELTAWRAPDGEQVERGLREMVLGLTKKLVVADQFAPISDAYFGAVGSQVGAPAAWCAVIAFTVQIYFDFSGYSDIAIGSARLLGFAFPANFRRPYLAVGIADFWRRWHISLSTWLRDYLYIPLGGSRGGTLATLRNVMITMLLGGLWHGASWTFVAWGGYYGLLLCLERVSGIPRELSGWGPVRILRMLITLLLVMIGWVFFRAASFPDAFTVLHAMVLGGPGPATIAPWLLVPLAVALAIGLVQERGARWDWQRIPIGVQAGALAGLLLALEVCSWPGQSVPFVYFKF